MNTSNLEMIDITEHVNKAFSDFLEYLSKGMIFERKIFLEKKELKKFFDERQIYAAWLDFLNLIFNYLELYPCDILLFGYNENEVYIEPI